MIPRKDTRRFRVVTHLKTLTKSLVPSIDLHGMLPEDSTARPVQEIPFVVGNSAIEGEVVLLK